MTSPLRMIDWADAAARPLLGETAADFLRNLGGPSAIRIPGRDRSRTRALVTLLHGNEPSGTIALHRWLGQLDSFEPAVDALVIIASVDAALEPPGFANRMLPGRRDLNRCFAPPFYDREGHVAGAILSLLAESGAECLVDLHNNTGHNPPYGVITAVDTPRLRLVRLFAHAAMLNQIRLATLTEAALDMPAVTIECGRSGDPAADLCAYEGIQRYFGRREIDCGDPAIDLFTDPVRVCVVPGVSVAFGDAPLSAVELTLVEHIETYNFGTIEAGERLGWTRAHELPLEAYGADGVDCAPELFRVDDGELVTCRPLVPVMMTTDARVVVADCLCYVVSRATTGTT